MASLASFRTLLVTAVGFDGDPDLGNVVAVRWDSGGLGAEESSIADFVYWLDHGDSRAFVQRTDGTRGPRVHVYVDDGRRRIRTRDNDDAHVDELLLLPTYNVHRRPRKHSRVG